MRTCLEQARIDCPMPPPPEIPARYQGASITMIEDTNLQALATEYLRKFEVLGSEGIGPVLLGRSRTYKTVAAAALAKGIWKAFSVGVVFVGCIDQLPQMELLRYDPGTAKRIKQWCATPVLVLDDFMIARPGTWAADILLAVLSARFNALRPTIITGNIILEKGREWAALAEIHNPALAHRLEEGGRGFTLFVE